MKAWHTQNKDGELQEIVFADTKHEAIYKSEASGWADYIDCRARRAPYADGLQDQPKALREAQLDDGWWFECDKCTRTVTLDDNLGSVTDEGKVLCKKCYVEVSE